MRSSNSRFVTYQCAVPIKDITELETNVELFKKEYPRVQLQDKKKETKSVVTGEKITGVIYVCYEENSTELYNDAGNLNHMFVTADVAQALDWTKHSLSNAEANNYLPITDDEMKQFISNIGREQYSSVWVYHNQDENAKENYGICVDSFDLSKSAELLGSVFGQIRKNKSATFPIKEKVARFF